MPKGVKASEELKQLVREDYNAGILTVDQISSKYGICRRSIYDWIFCSDRYRNQHNKRTHAMTYLSQDEIELILLMISECDGILNSKNKIISRPLEDRLLNMADEIARYQLAFGENE